ncbi:MAG: glycosyltransferase family 39 protein [Bacteroidota bacterium]
MNSRNDNKSFLIRLLGTGAALMVGLGDVHLFDWDEINFAEITREMCITHCYSHVQVDFAPFYEKPPLFFWLQALSMQLGGVNAFSARFPNVVTGLLTVATLYKIGTHYQDRTFGLLWAALHTSALLPHFYFRTGIIDPVFNYWVLVSIYAWVRAQHSPSQRTACLWALQGGLTTGLAVLTKGPVGWLITCLTSGLYSFKLQPRSAPYSQLIPIFSTFALGIPLLWLGHETWHHGWAFLQAFTQYHIDLFSQPVAHHGQPVYYHFLVVFVGCFPASVLSLGSFYRPTWHGRLPLFSVMQALFWVVMILFSLATTKIVHYSSLAYFPVTWLAAHYLYAVGTRRTTPTQPLKYMLCAMGIGIGAVLAALPVIGLYKALLYKWVSDPFTRALIATPVAWAWRDTLVGVIYIVLTTWAYRAFCRLSVMSFARLSSLATTLSLMLGTLWIVPKIEAHVQGPAIAFYKACAGQAVYVRTVGFKSYAHLFYTRKGQADEPISRDIATLLTGPIDRPAYFVVRVTDQGLLAAYQDVVYLKKEGGFAFYKRAPASY